jgi:hypothetical protein
MGLSKNKKHKDEKCYCCGCVLGSEGCDYPKFGNMKEWSAKHGAVVCEQCWQKAEDDALHG